MRPTLCSRCKKNVAVIFIKKIENGQSVNEGLCLKCAKSLGIKQVDDIVAQMGISDEDLDNLTDEMTGMFSMMQNMVQGEGDEEDGEDMDSQTATFPFLNKLFGGERGGNNSEELIPQIPSNNGKEPDAPAPKNTKNKKRKFLDSYCLNLTQRARDNTLDRVIGRDVETERVIQILNRRQKNNPCLIGEPGVGKTAIAEGLA